MPRAQVTSALWSAEASCSAASLGLGREAGAAGRRLVHACDVHNDLCPEAYFECAAVQHVSTDCDAAGEYAASCRHGADSAGDVAGHEGGFEEVPDVLSSVERAGHG